MKDIIIVGAGGVGRETVQLIDDINTTDQVWNIKGFVDDNHDLLGKNINGYEVIGNIDELNSFDNEIYIICTISNPIVKKRIVDRITNYQVKYANLIHPTAIVSSYASLGIDIIVQAFCLLSPNVVIEDHVQLNPQCGIGHESIIKKYSSIYWNVNLSGNVIIGEGCILGTKSTVLQQRAIGDWSTVGANATVVKDLPSYCTAVGIPAKPIKFHQEVCK